MANETGWNCSQGYYLFELSQVRESIRRQRRTLRVGFERPRFDRAENNRLELVAVEWVN